jgi:hypothetical protein
MNSKIRRRALRNFGASLFLSEMSAAEMRQIADELSYGNLASELGELIRDMATLSTVDSSKGDFGRNKNPFERTKNVSSPQDSRLRVALNVINRRRLSKKAIWELMRTASPEFDAEQISADATIKEHVSKYFETVSANDVARFLNLLEGETTDAYLSGISKRG